MSQALEVEFKNILSPEEYQQLVETFQLNKSDLKRQENVYFDTADKSLAERHAGLRIRLTDSYCHLTLKETISEEEKLETTDKLSRSQGAAYIAASSIGSAQQVQAKLEDWGIKLEDLRIIGQFQTARYNFPWKGQDIALDHCRFDRFEDYELEMESHDGPEAGRTYFEEFLKLYQIERRPSMAKMGRMQRKEALYQFN